MKEEQRRGVRESVKQVDCHRCSSHKLHEWSRSQVRLAVESGLKTTLQVQSTMLQLPGYATVAVRFSSTKTCTDIPCTNVNTHNL